VVAVSAEPNALSSDGEETRFKALLFQHPQGFFENVLGGLLSWASANANYHKDSSEINNR
jgi:hypothetical protein